MAPQTDLSDILVSDSADLLNIGSSLGNFFQRVAGENDLILDVLGGNNLNTLGDVDAADNLLAQEVTDLDLSLVVVDVDVDREMCVDVAHLVLEAKGDTDDHVLDESPNGADGSDRLADTMVELDADDALRLADEGDRKMGEILGKDTAGTRNGNVAGFNGDRD